MGKKRTPPNSQWRQQHLTISLGIIAAGFYRVSKSVVVLPNPTSNKAQRDLEKVKAAELL
jgi:hypothetical protein